MFSPTPLIRNFIQLLPGSLLLLSWCILIQQFPNIVGCFYQLSPKWNQDGPSSSSIQINTLPEGKYYLSLGQVLDETEIWMNHHLIEKGKITVGKQIEVLETNTPLHLQIKWKARERWRNKLFDLPILAPYGPGHIIHILRVFTKIYLGPGLSLLLILFAVLNFQISKPQSSKAIPHIILGVTGFWFNLFITLIPDLILKPATTTFIQLTLKVALSAAFLNLIRYYSKPSKGLIAFHLFAVLSVLVSYLANPDWYILIYKVQICIFTFLTLLNTIYLIDGDQNNFETRLLAQLGLVWTVLQGFGAIFYWLDGPSYLTVWSPSIIAVLSCVEFYLIYRTAVNVAAQSESSQKIYRIVSQVAHDIRSPIAALRVLHSNATGLKNDEKLIADLALQRIDGIAQDILQKDQTTYLGTITARNPPILPAVESLIKEKQFEYQGQIILNFINKNVSSPITARFEEQGFRRILSNLINNGCEAMNHRGVIEVTISMTPDKVFISIRDYGHGISPETLFLMRQGKFDSSKPHGNGLGLSEASRLIELWGGILRIESKINLGTIVTIELIQ